MIIVVDNIVVFWLLIAVTGVETSMRSSPTNLDLSMSGSLQMLLGTWLVIATSGGRNDPSPVKRSSECVNCNEMLLCIGGHQGLIETSRHH